MSSFKPPYDSTETQDWGGDETKLRPWCLVVLVALLVVMAMLSMLSCDQGTTSAVPVQPVRIIVQNSSNHTVWLVTQGEYDAYTERGNIDPLYNQTFQMNPGILTVICTEVGGTIPVRQCRWVFDAENGSSHFLEVTEQSLQPLVP